MDIYELKRRAENKSDVLLFNPLLKDFSTKFKDFDKVVLKASEITPVDGRIAERVKKQLITFIMNEREIDPLSKDVNKILEEVEVVL